MKVQIVVLTYYFSFVLSSNDKRILLSDASYVQQLEQKVQTLTANMAAMTAQMDDVVSKFVSLTNEVAQRKADGYAGTSWYDDTGAATNYLCLAPDPELQKNKTATPYVRGPRIYGVEYYIPGEWDVGYYDDAKCAVCRSHQPSVLMIPGRTSCYSGWTEEYTGYLAAGQRTNKAGSQFVCLDDQPEAILHGTGEQDGGYFEPVTSHCGSLTCPPYIENEIVLCVVCSK